MSYLRKLHCERRVKRVCGPLPTTDELSTDRTHQSSDHYPFKALAFALLFALVPCAQAPAQAASPAAKGTVGERLAADLTWSQAERDVRFAGMEQLFPVHTVRRSGPVRVLPMGKPLSAELIEQYMDKEHLAGVLVLQDGRIRAEQYALGLTATRHWTTFSVTKAVTDTLVGAALRGGSIHSLDDDVAQYLPQLRGSAYQGVTVRQLLTMTSGVRWNENYTSATADNVLLYQFSAPPGEEPVTAYMRRLPRAVAPGTRWNYNTGETDLLGVLLRRATGKTLAEQLSATVWKAAGMQSDATWIATASGLEGEEFGGSGLSATLRDLGRFGQWALEGGHGAVSGDWLAAASHTQVIAGNAGYGYGWWPQENDTFAALGIFGQSIFVDPARKLVIVTVGDWSEATGAAHTAARAAFWRAVQSAVDAN